MTQAIVIVKKEFSGKTFSNTWCISWPANVDQWPSDANLVAAGGTNTFDEASTNPVTGGAAYQGGTSILNAILGFERMLHYSGVKFKNVYVTDGRKKGPGGANKFISRNLGFMGLKTAGATSDGAVYAGGVTLMLSRVPVGFTEHQGRIFVRTTLTEGDVKLGGLEMAEWTDEDAQELVTNYVNNSLATSQLNDWFADMETSDAAGVYLAVPHYYYNKDNDQDPNNGTLVGSTLMQTIQVAGINYRQVKKGKKRKFPTAIGA